VGSTNSTTISFLLIRARFRLPGRQKLLSGESRNVRWTDRELWFQPTYS
jgi:hypothetical protein